MFEMWVFTDQSYDAIVNWMCTVIKITIIDHPNNDFLFDL